MKSYLHQLIGDKALSEKETFEVFELLMNPDTSLIQESEISAYLSATAKRLPTADELVGAAKSLLQHAIPVDLACLELIDTCGTGGSGRDTFNTSTMVALILAAAGAHVAKHGNRAATSRCGSADVLEALGVRIENSPEQSQKMFTETRFCFLYAPLHHPATRRVQSIRRKLGLRTIFNFLGPLVNPARPARQLLGVSSQDMVPVMAEALSRLGCRSAMVVSAADGLDEISPCCETAVSQIHERSLSVSRIDPKDYPLSAVTMAELVGSSPAEAAKNVLALARGEKSPRHTLVCLNAGAALVLAEKAHSIAEGIEQAGALLGSGKVLTLIEQLQKISRVS